jgi:hypothetical protein
VVLDGKGCAGSFPAREISDGSVTVSPLNLSCGLEDANRFAASFARKRVFAIQKQLSKKRPIPYSKTEKKLEARPSANGRQSPIEGWFFKSVCLFLKL